MNNPLHPIAVLCCLFSVSLCRIKTSDTNIVLKVAVCQQLKEWNVNIKNFYSIFNPKYYIGISAQVKFSYLIMTFSTHLCTGTNITRPRRQHRPVPKVIQIFQRVRQCSLSWSFLITIYKTNLWFSHQKVCDWFTTLTRQTKIKWFVVFRQAYQVWASDTLQYKQSLD